MEPIAAHVVPTNHHRMPKRHLLLHLLPCRAVNISLALLFIASTALTQQVYPVGAKINWVRTWDAVGPETNPDNLITRPLTDVRMATQYMDGVGRPVQTVIKQGSLISGGTATDLTSTVMYDELGREQYKFLPAPANTTGGNTSVTDGLFKRNPFEQQNAFYGSSNAALNPIAGQGETYYYGKTEFEASPLSRPLKAMAPGNSWTGAARGVQTSYMHNTATDAVRKGYALFSGKDGSLYEGGDDFASQVTSGINVLMGVKDDEIQARMGVMLNSKFKVLMHDGRTEGDGGNNADTYLMKDGSTKKTDAISGSDPNVAGIRVSWDPSSRQTANGVKNPNGADPLLSLSHELVGHGFQGTVKQITPRSINGSIQTPEGYLRATEADAQSMWNRVANATGRTDMRVTSYTALRKFDANGNTVVDGQGRPANVSRVAYTLPTPGYQINWNRKGKY
jgi:hypothetical protein